jgi:hypothetical protein
MRKHVHIDTIVLYGQKAVDVNRIAEAVRKAVALPEKAAREIAQAVAKAVKP